MPRRTLSQSSFFDPEFVQPDCLPVGTVPWLLARHRSKLLPSWLLAGWRGESRRGRDAWPATTLLTLLLLRWSEEGISRLGSTKRARHDTQWRAAMGLHLRTQVPNEKTLREFEAFLQSRHPSCDVPRYLLLHGHIVRLCLDGVVVGQTSNWVIDSTPMWCYGAVLDTIRLLGDGTRMLALRWAKATKQSVAQIVEQWQAPHVLAKSTKGHFRIDWRDAAERARVVAQLASAALRSIEHVRHNIAQARPGRRKRLLRLCRSLGKIVAQDLERDDAGRLVIARRVARDRLVSLTDPSARHGRKTRRDTFNGFKLHMLGDIASGLIAAVTVTPANKHDNSVAHRLIRRAKMLCEQIDSVLGDTAYGGATLRAEVKQQLDVEIIAPPPPVEKRADDALTRQDIDIDFEAKTATCAAGKTTDDHRRVWSNDYNRVVSAFRWSNDDCAQCSLRQRCQGKRQSGHHIRLHPHEQHLRQARANWSDAEYREMYRKRTQGERLVNRMTRHGARQARSHGLAKANLQAHLIAMRANLQLLAIAIADQ
ncbi:MAG: transposase [Myxococcales bacterium]|nr:transposase [Myxococcales bacterium]